MEGPGFPVFESADAKLKNGINTKLSELLKRGTSLADIVELLDAQEFLEYIEPGKKQSTVAHFDVDGFIKKRTSENRKFSLPEEYIKIDETILPPSEMEIRSGNGTGFKEAGIIPRSTMLMEIFTEMGLKYSVMEGKNDPKMVRKLSYLIFTIPSMQKMVLINDEEGNATFVIHKVQQEEWQRYAKKTKEELSLLPYDLVSYFNYPNKKKEGHEERWKDKIKSLLIDGPHKPEDIAKVETVPEGWLTASKLGPIMSANRLTVNKFIERYRSNYPEWFKIYRNQSRTAEHFHPELISLMRKEFDKFKAKSGWLGPYMLAEKIDVDGKTIKKRAENYRINHPDWFKNYKDQDGRIREHYSPELVSIIKNELKKPAIPIEQAPDGWLTEFSTMKSIKITWETIKKIVNIYRTDYPDWFKIYKDKRGTPREHYSPELIEKIQEDKEKDFAPAGWISAYHLSKSIGIAVGTVQYFAEEYRAQHPEWFKDYLHETNRRSIEYFSPELSKVLSDRYGKIKLSPNDWLIAKTLGKSIGIAKATVKIHAEKYRTEHPEWFKIYKNTRGLQLEHYSPELVEILREKISKNKDAKAI